mmetsp:Transcript_76321/g.218394  ORF Transcript_76321/g.218394 Transcript_76321/m.218394 type:complete len:236 (+) Transcript_76321:515-1222(+)
MTPNERYTKAHTDLINAVGGRVYLDTQRPRVCIAGPEDRSRGDLGYQLLPESEVFSFYELRAAAVDLRHPSMHYDHEETVRRAGAILDTLIQGDVKHVVLSAFGCGAFQNPASFVAQAFRTALTQPYKPPANSNSTAAESVHRSTETETLSTRAESLEVVAFAIFDAGYGPDNHAPFAREFASWDEDHGIGDSTAAGEEASAKRAKANAAEEAQEATERQTSLLGSAVLHKASLL